MPQTQGTFGFYFHIGEALYGVTARHVLFGLNQANEEYTYVSFDDFLKSIQAEIDRLFNTVTFLDSCIKAFTGKPLRAGPLETAKTDLKQTNEKIEALKEFYNMMQMDWSEPKSRVIGHVVWAPPITGNTLPHGYTQDVCVVKLDKNRFMPNFVQNVINLGVKIDPGEFMSMMYDDKADFDYPWDRHLFKLWSILPAEQISYSTAGDVPVRFVFKNGSTTGTTIGRLSRFQSKVRMYGLTGTFTSTETPVLPYGSNSYFGTFSEDGDSGAVVCGPNVDIAYTTPMHWLWDEVILARFPGASLYFD
ncbi:uncharacterized protein LACBIDRAFT_303834 [Laccaria bicolor S238N-H82]|uniref:Predicted protein n=1 Tax=Laccaria bicolor (strain S238N-H82 / ATCC MYA-4686) TaxID=486041 RepID=B0DKF8_LACBS|nr:uncharacterized protein LACBIDRAFT_303834 [Laccaria bicolor S238N-H82]EDR04937.1 predicted protein [Laccaria bicolor S238N-H82]|eukprot:XP_001884327.1 predicted protein [Laccaria bicolor S238N-H82]